MLNIHGDMMRVLVTGASGLLGKYLMETANDSHDVYGTYHTNYVQGCHELDICDASSALELVLTLCPDVIIHAAALGSVDYCENNVTEGYAVNVDGAVNVASAAIEVGAKFVFISSNAVYEGDNPPYGSHSVHRDVNKYGNMKIEAELSLQHALDDDKLLIVRPIMLYGWPYPGGRGNWVTRVLEFLRAGMPLHIVADTLTQPTYAYNCAVDVWDLIECNIHGSVNIGGMRICSLYEFSLDIAECFYLDAGLLKPVKSSYFPDIAPRPRNTTFDSCELPYKSALNHMKEMEYEN